ncbi:tyrosine-type recombinase/integrase [bacterium]|nr:tyrosine-type recombinase/integrase [bacterium]
MAKQLKFTDNWLKSVAPPSDGRIEYRDTDCAGLILRVTNSGAKSFSYGFRFGTRFARLTLGKYPDVGLKEARVKLIEAKGLVIKGIDPRANKQAKRQAKNLTVDRLAHDFVELYAKPKNKSWKQAEDNLRLHLLPYLGHYPIHQVERSDIHHILDKLGAAGKTTAANRALSHFRKFFNWLVERGYLEHAPTDRVKQPYPERRKDRVLSDDEIKRIWNALNNLRPAHANFVRMLLLTAQRREEVASMRFASVADSVWHLEGNETKNKQSTAVPLSSHALAIVNQQNNAEAIYVFSTDAEHKTHVQSYSKIKKQLDALSGVCDWTLHDIRRTVATKLAEQGTDERIIKRILNHTDNSVTSIYNRHSYIKERRQALQAWGDWLSALGSR